MSFNYGTGRLTGTPSQTQSATTHTITATNSSGTSTATFTLTVTHGVASKVAITRASIGNTDNIAFATQPQITVQDSGSRTATSSSAVVTATISGAGGTLIGTVTATAVSGVATFTNLGIDGTNGTTYTITYTVTSLTAATQTVKLIRYCDGTFTCAVGDVGPGGGTIFYADLVGFNCGTNFTSTGSPNGGLCNYLEAAATTGVNAWTDTTGTWGKTNYSVATSDEIGSGYKNTLAMISPNNTGQTAATIARGYTGGGLTDWYLPSKNDLSALYSNRSTVGGFVGSAYYWSSSQGNLSNSWLKDFTFDNYDPAGKTGSYHVRPIRSFGNAQIVTTGLLRQIDAGVPSSYASGVTLQGGLSSSSNSFNFDGTDDYIDLGSITEIGSSSTEFSVEVWFKPDALETASLIQNGSDYNSNTYYLWQQSSSELVFEVYGSSSFDAITFDEASNYEIGTWYHLVGVWKSGERLKLYKNGSASLNKTWATGSIQTSLKSGDTNTLIGQRNSSFYFDGNLPIVRLYTTALTEAQVLQNFNAQKTRFGL
jgi:hypothetical protein